MKVCVILQIFFTCCLEKNILCFAKKNPVGAWPPLTQTKSSRKEPAMSSIIAIYNTVRKNEADLSTALGYTTQSNRMKNASMLRAWNINFNYRKQGTELYLHFPLPEASLVAKINFASTIRLSSHVATAFFRRKRNSAVKAPLTKNSKNELDITTTVRLLQRSASHGDEIVIKLKVKPPKISSAVLLVASMNQRSFPMHSIRKQHIRHRRALKRGAKKQRKALCRLEQFTVDFRKLGWDEWIIHPQVFNAKVCSGRCPSPLTHSLHPTNHSLLISLFRRTNRSISKACCVPTKLSAISMLHFEDDQIVLRQYKDVVASQCGCR